MKIQLLNDIFTFYELKYHEKIYVDVFVFMLLHVYRRYLSPPVRKMCPILAARLMGESIIILCHIKVLSAHIRKYTNN